MTKRLENLPIPAERHKNIGGRGFLKAALLSTAIMGGTACAHNEPKGSVPQREASGNSLRSSQTFFYPVEPQAPRYISEYHRAFSSSGQATPDITVNPDDITINPHPFGLIEAQLNRSLLRAQSRRSFYYWFVYQDRGNGFYIHNPDHYSPMQYTGAVLRNARLADGSVGDFAVASRQVDPGTYEALIERDGTVDPANVLFRLEPGSLIPIVDSTLQSNLSSVCTHTPFSSVTARDNGTTVFVVFVTQ